MTLRWLAIGLALAIGWAGRAAGEVAVGLRVEQEILLLFEPVRVTVALRNPSGRAVELTSDGDQSWLSFVIADGDGRTVNPTAEGLAESAVRVEPGQTVYRSLDLLPRYDLRSRGVYRIQAAVQGAGLRSLSTPVRFTILSGTELWSQAATIPATEGKAEESRRYSLVTKRERSSEILYAGVRDSEHDLVYGMVRLGTYLPLAPPRPLVDRQGRLHLLYRNEPRTLASVCLDPQGQVVGRAIYSDLTSTPALQISEEGEVTVRGGLRLEPGQRPPTEADLLPATPAAARPKKQWWQFWK